MHVLPDGTWYIITVPSATDPASSTVPPRRWNDVNSTSDGPSSTSTGVEGHARHGVHVWMGQRHGHRHRRSSRPTMTTHPVAVIAVVDDDVVKDDEVQIRPILLHNSLL